MCELVRQRLVGRGTGYLKGIDYTDVLGRLKNNGEKFRVTLQPYFSEIRFSCGSQHEYDSYFLSTV